MCEFMILIISRFLKLTHVLLFLKGNKMRNVKIAASQMSCTSDIQKNLKKAEQLVRKAADSGAQIILLQELFETLYFCQKEKPEFYRYAKSVDADGSISETYRKSHIPDGPGYEEKYYFTPGDSGFKVFETKYANIGVGICWDQWFPEAARAMALMGAELLFYPTAIGSEPDSPEVDSKDHWQRCMIGHAACNLIPVIASNRIGTETIDDSTITFYGSSFITGPTGELLKEADRSTETVLIQEFDLDALLEQRLEWGLFRDRRPDLYQVLLTNDGIIK
jgi:N-carbamoylputrescine amidase